MYTCIHGFTYTCLHNFMNSFRFSPFYFTVFRLVCFNAFPNDIFHKGTNRETFLTGNGLHLIHKFFRTYKREMPPGYFRWILTILGVNMISIDRI